MTDRDTHFTGFAKELWNDLLWANGYGYIDKNTHDDPTDPANYIETIARRTHDLVVHILMNAPTSSLQHCCSRLEAEGCIESIPDMPDMPELPKVEE